MGNWEIKQAPMLAYDGDSDSVITFDSQKLLYRSDNQFPLASVGRNYNVVQPRQVVDFFREIIDSMGFNLVTCGVLYSGRKFWAQADIGNPVSILGQERVEGKLLLATSCDGSMKTRAQYTTTCVVCNNTLRMATATDAESVELSHAGAFDPEAIREALELRPEAFLRWQLMAEDMAGYKLESKKAGDFFDLVFNGAKMIIPDNALATADDIAALEADRGNSKAIDTCIRLFNGEMLGGNLDARRGTLWGAVNSVTEFIDHHRGCKTMDARIDRAWFGDGAKIKNNAWEEAVLLAA
jgi:phage/plasmid-like protein (TIGR03299 family)